MMKDFAVYPTVDLPMYFCSQYSIRLDITQGVLGELLDKNNRSAGPSH